MLGGGFGGFGGLDVLDQVFLRLGLGGDNGRLAVALGLFQDTEFLDRLLLLGDGLLDGDPFPDHLGDVTPLAFDVLVLGDGRQFDFTVATDDFQQTVLLNAFGLDRDDPLAVLFGDGDLTCLVLTLDPEDFVGANVGLFRLEALLGPNLVGHGLFACADRFDLTTLLQLGVGLTAFELEDRFAGLDVLFCELFFLVAAVVVGPHRFDGGQLGDLADALGVEDVLGVQHRHGGLLEEVDRGVFEAVSVEVGTDDTDDLVAELVALGVQIDEVELFTDGLQRLGEFGVEKLL